MLKRIRNANPGPDLKILTKPVSTPGVARRQSVHRSAQVTGHRPIKAPTSNVRSMPDPGGRVARSRGH
eukprot:4019859-Prymnesium_polylepis.1